MSYLDIARKANEDAHIRLTSTKILDAINKLRRENNENSARRWVWELIQNAKDVTNGRVSIEIDFKTDNNNNYLKFKHNGKPFTIGNLAFLIQQVSIKDRDSEEDQSKSTGRFGTGFLTTHLLSEKVEIECVVKEDNEIPKKVTLLLDRSGSSLKEISDSVSRSMDIVNNIEACPDTEYIQGNFNTIFTYKLNSRGIGVAQTGVEDLHTSIMFTLVFLSEIGSVKMVNENVEYCVKEDATQISENFKICTIQMKNSSDIADYKIALLTNGDTSIAIQVSDKNGRLFLQAFNKSVPKLFCDFPLIGTENFPFPVIINNPYFEVTEPRDSIYLNDDDPSNASANNKQIIKEAIELYSQLLKYASENKWGSLYILVKIPRMEKTANISQDWIDKDVRAPLRKMQLFTPVVDVGNQDGILEPILKQSKEQNIIFPYHSNEQIRNQIWDLSTCLNMGKRLPIKQDIHNWQEVIWNEEQKLTIRKITEYVSKLTCLKNLEAVLSNNYVSTNWLNQYYLMLSQEENVLGDIQIGEFLILPNQNGSFKRIIELKKDDKIEEHLKNVSKTLDYDVKDLLIHNDISFPFFNFEKVTQDDVIEKINIQIMQNKGDIDNACNYLVTLFCDDINFPKIRKQIYYFSEKIYHEKVNHQRDISIWSHKIWFECDRIHLKNIVKSISETNDINGLQKKLELTSKKETLQWLDSFVDFLIKNTYESLIELKRFPILPNQNGVFIVKDNLFLDDEIDDDLKDILLDLGVDCRNELLDINIALNLSNSHEKNNRHIATEIKSRVHDKLRNEMKKTEETKSAFNKILLWFSENGALAEQLFDELYTYRHNLYDDNEIIANIKQAESVSRIMIQYGFNNMTELEIAIKKSIENDYRDQYKEITEDDLLSLGISSEHEWDNALKNKAFADNLYHSSTPSIEMFIHAKKIIERAKNNVINYLKTLTDIYNCNELEHLSTTIISGVKKNGNPIKIVIRPADSGEVILYYQEEKDVLDYEDYELWIDNGRDIPTYLTLGRILKITGINRIPLKNIFNRQKLWT